MNEQPTEVTTNTNPPESLIREKKSFSIVWVVPIVALLIGGWLVYKALSEKGPTITISFKSADGLEAGKTKIKYKDVEVGEVVSIVLEDDLSTVTVTAELGKNSKAYLTDKTRFWVVRARVSAGEISGLGTLFGGAYIAIDPVKEGKPLNSFIGLESPPIVTTDLPGRHYVLKAERLGSLGAGSPIYFRQIQVGQVESYELDKEGRHVDIRIFIDAPHAAYIHKNTRFWNAGGIDLSMDANGLKIDSQSLVSILSGGIAFDNPVDLKQNDPAEDNEMFILFDSRDDAMAQAYSVKRYWQLEFSGSVRGLTKGAPVEFRGLQVGKVEDVSLKIGQVNNEDILISVLVETEPERLVEKGVIQNDQEYMKLIDSLVARGLRAQLRTGSIITGQLYVDLDFRENVAPKTVDWDLKYPIVPTIPASLEELMAVFNKMLEKIETIPFEQIGQDIRSMVKNLDSTVKASEELLKTVNSQIAPEISATLKQATHTMAELEKTFGNESPLNHNAIQALGELSEAARSLRMLSDYLERHPEALIYGKGDNK